VLKSLNKPVLLVKIPTSIHAACDTCGVADDQASLVRNPALARRGKACIFAPENGAMKTIRA
jgi:hypothetical protein